MVVRTGQVIAVTFAVAMNITKYLALEPNAKDARAAQDKLYQWEGEAKTAKIQIKIEGRAPGN